MRKSLFAAATAAALFLVTPVEAQNRPDPASLIAAQREAMAAFARMDGVWRGPAWTITPNGRHELTQTERIGTFLGGSVRVIEGRGYNADGSVGFNALGVVSYNPASSSYTMTSWAMGNTGAFPIRPTPEGYVWEIPAGPGVTIRYTATIRDGTLREIGERLVEGAAPVQFFEMNLRRVGDTSWPAADPVPMR